MSSGVSVARGAEMLRCLLDTQSLDVRRLDLSGFRHWLDHHLNRWKHDAIFSQRTKIRSLRESQPQLLLLEKQHRFAAAADAATASYDRLQRLAQEIADADKAVVGLTRAVQDSPPEKRPALQRKLASFQARRQLLQTEYRELVQATPERRTLLRIEDDLQRLHHAAGLDREEAALKRLQRERGRRSGRSGDSFEQLTIQTALAEIVPELLCEEDAAGEVHLLRGVTLGAAGVELDQLVLRQPPSDDEPVEVLAIVEVKRNLNDVAHGFRRRQQNLAWLAGDAAGYDPRVYRTRYFVSGHFDRPVVRQHGEKKFLFDRGSFRHFHRDAATQLFLDRLYLITRPGPMWGLSSAALNRISYRVATDRHWDPNDEEYLCQLMQWCRTLAHEIETPDVLRIYASKTPRARQVLLAAEHPRPNPPIFDPCDFKL